MHAQPRPALAGVRWWTPLVAFLLTCTLSACDLPFQSARITGDGFAARLGDADAASDVAAANAPRLRLAAGPTASAVDPTEPRLPPVDALEITPMEKAGDPAGNALLAVRFRDASALADDVPMLVDERKFVLRRDADDKNLFRGMVDFDFDLFLKEQDERRRLAESSSTSVSPVFEGRSLAGEDKLTFVDPVALQRAREASIAIAIPGSILAMPPSAVDPRRELMITDLSVVNDPTRTFDLCNNVGNPNGAWTFKTLMTNMANQPSTGLDPAVFVESWLKNWTVNQFDNFNIPARTNIGALVLNSWPRIGGKLDLDKAPFRLLAIVNRVDLRANPVYGGSGGNAGEGRFVFGVVNRNANGGCSTMPFTVIFEYGVPIRGCTNVKNYAQQWINLGGIALGSAAFNPALQAITDQFTTANAAPAKPNGSALNQLRTNEIALASPWELREFVLPAPNSQLTIISTKQTPHSSRNNTALLANYINVNAPAILAGTHVVGDLWAGQPFLTGSTTNPSTANAAAWNAPGVANQPRHLFSLATCNACHGAETRDNTVGSGDRQFVHVDVRLPGAPSQLSKFLLGNGTLAAPSTFNKPDPINGAPIRQFGDLLRRQQDMANLINSSCRATGLLQAVRFQALEQVH